MDSDDFRPDTIAAQALGWKALDGGEGRLGDSGLRIETDRLLVRVVGFGGRP